MTDGGVGREQGELGSKAKQVTGIDVAIKRKLHESGKHFWAAGSFGRGVPKLITGRSLVAALFCASTRTRATLLFLFLPTRNPNTHLCSASRHIAAPPQAEATFFIPAL
jgi:hypothetical protein